jgi:hypothetical protein
MAPAKESSAAAEEATGASCWFEVTMGMKGGRVDRKGVIGALRRRLAQMINDRLSCASWIYRQRTTMSRGRDMDEGRSAFSVCA